MAYNLQITCPDIGVNFNCKYEKLDGKAKKPNIVAKAPNGKEVKERQFYQGQVVPTAEEAKDKGLPHMEKRWCDDDGNVYAKSQLTFLYNDQPVSEISQTKVMTIEGFQDVKNYTDSYVIDKYYEVFASDDDMKKDIDKKIAVAKNNSAMRKLWKHLKDTNKVARGELCVSSRGFVASDAYIRAIEFGNSWGLEIGIFKEEKIYAHLQEGEPQAVQVAQQATKRIKMV